MTTSIRSEDDPHPSDDAYPALLFDTYVLPPIRAIGRLGIASLEAWPAAGGGLLLGIAEPALAGAAPLRAPVKTIFLRIDPSSGVLLTLPYVALEQEARTCVLTLVSSTLSLPEGAAILDQRGSPAHRPIVDVCPAAERSLRCCAIAATTLLKLAAAEIWRVSAAICTAAHGSIRAPGRSAAYGELAADAALQAMPDVTQFRNDRVAGRPVRDALRVDTKVSTIPTFK